MEILWLKSHGETHERIAVLAEGSRRTVQRVLDIFASGGLEAVHFVLASFLGWVWCHEKLFKQALHSRHHTNYADFHVAIETCIAELSTTHKPALDSLITLNFQTFENVPLLPA